MTRTAAALTASLLLVAGCGDDGGDDADGSSGGTTTSVAETTTAPGEPTTEPVAPSSTTAPVDEPAELVVYGTFFGECAGFCERTLTFDGASVALDATSTIDGVEHRSTGTLTGDGVDTLADGLVDLDLDSLQEVYGCPDCADGGGARVLLRAGDRGREVTYPYRTPPPELAVVDGVGEAVLDALVTCQPNAVVIPDDGCIALPL